MAPTFQRTSPVKPPEGADELSRLRREKRQLREERLDPVAAQAFQKPRLGLPGRPGRCRRALPVHEHEPGLVRDRHHGAHARRVQGWFHRVALVTAVTLRSG